MCLQNEIKEQLTKIQNAKKQHETNKIKLGALWGTNMR